MAQDTKQIETDLRSAIRAVARGDAAHDATRRSVRARATEHDLAGLLPDNWSDDGSLNDTRNVWASMEERDTANDVFAALSSAVNDAYGDQYDCWYVWVQDWYGAGSDTDPYMVVYRAGEDLYAAPFSYDEESKVVLGEPVKVRPVTSYVERKKPSALLEWRKRKADDLKGLERRRIDFSTAGMEIREKDDDTWNLTGFACVTEAPYEVGFYTETIKRGAFKRTLSENPDVQLLVNHDGLPLARTRSGTLRLEERIAPDTDGKTGLWVDADLDKLDPDAQRLQRKMARGDMDAMSFAFQSTDPDSWNDDYTQRKVKAVSIHRGDVSVVNQGANPAAAASIRSQDAVHALHRIGGEGIVVALTEWRDHTLMPIEERAGKALSASTMEVLSNVLNLVAAADEAVDEAQPLLAELMGVPNPDADDAAEAEPDDTAARAAVPIPDYTTRARQQLALLRRAA